MKSKRIAIFMPTLAGGGAESAMLVLAEGLISRGYTVDLLLKQESGALIDKIPDALNLINFDVPLMRHTLKPLRAYLKHAQPDAIISALNLSNVVSILATRLLKKKPQVIITVHGLISQEAAIYHKLVYRSLFGLTFPHADAIVAVSQVCAQDLIDYLHPPESKVQVIYNPVIDAELYKRADQSVQYEWLPEGEEKTILNIGRLEPVKDHLTLLKAFKKIREKYDARLIILGEGSLKPQIKVWVDEMNLTPHVLMPGFIHNPLPLLKKADVLVNASLRESFSMIIIEAMACACPVVSTACGGPEEILDHGRYGHLVPVGDAQGMAVAIENVFEGDRRLAPPEWLAQFHKDVNVEKYIDLIEK